MTSEEGENFSMPSAGSTPITGSTSTTDGTLVSKRRKLTSVVWNDFDKRESLRPIARMGQNTYMYT